MCISAAVGKNAANQQDDVLIVQALLNLNIQRLAPLPLLVADGGFGRFTQAYITEFQKRCVPTEIGMDTVRPGSATLAELLKAKAAALTAPVLEALMPLARQEQALRYFDPLVACMAQNQIDTPLRQAHFLAQLGHESGSLRFPRRSLTEAAMRVASILETRRQAMAGGSRAGDSSRSPAESTTLPMARRGIVTLCPATILNCWGPIRSSRRTAPAGIGQSRGLNALADKDDVRAITLKINGGFNGLDDRTRRLKLAKCLLL